MKKKPASRSAFFNPRVLFGIGICVMAAFMALFAFARQENPATQKAPQNTTAPSSTLPKDRAQLTAQTLDMDNEIDSPTRIPSVTKPWVDPAVIGAVFVVNTTADTQDATPGDGICADSLGACSLRAAITEANALAGTDTITVPAGTYITTLVAANENLNAGGDYDISSSMNINGAGSGTTFIQANAAPNTGTERVFHILTATTTVNFSDLTIRYGNATGVTSGGGVSVAAAATVGMTNVNVTDNRCIPIAGNNAFGGGIIIAAGSLTLTGCSVSNNSAIATGATVNGFAGGIYNQQAALTLNNCTVNGNVSSSFHGGIRSLSSTTAATTTDISNSTISNNVANGVNGAAAPGEGGGVTNIAASTFACTTNITRSTVSGNSAFISSAPGAGTAAGGVENFSVSTGAGVVNLLNSTVSGNTAGDAGGIYSDGAVATMSLDYTTVARNNASVGNGGGLYQDVTAGGVTTVKDSIVGDNTATTAGPDIFGTITTGTFNHIESIAGGTFVAGAGDVTGSDAGLSPLQNNGGPTFSHMPSALSPVLNTIASGTNGCGTTVLTDQRGFGFARPSGGACEKGSIERQPNDATPTPTPSGTPTPTPSPTPTATFTPVSTPTPTPTVTPPATVCDLTTGFDGDAIGTILAGGWVINNQSATIGTTNWFQGNSAVFPAFAGTPDSYVGANFNATTGTNTISDWLLTPPVTIQNGGQLVFYTRTVDSVSFPDRLQVRYSRNGTSSNVGVGPTQTGDFGTVPDGGTGNGDLILDINPTLTTTGYPNVWTQYSITLSGITGSPKGRFAFRYFVTGGGPTGANSDYIGIDSVTYACTGGIPTPTPSPTPTPTPTPSPTVCNTVLTHSVSQSPIPGSVSCNDGSPTFRHTDNSYWRSFNMAFFSGGQEYKVTSVTFGIETALHATPAPGTPTPTPGAGTPTPTPAPTPGTQPVTVRLYTQNAGPVFPGGTRTQIASQEIFVANQTATLVTVPMMVTVPAGTTELIMEVFTPDGQLSFNEFFIGSNALGQDAASFISAVDCGIASPTDVASIGFPNMHLIFDVNGACATPTPSAVPISGTVIYCSNPSLPPISGVTMTLSGASSGTTTTDGSGNYSFTGLPGNNYTVTPSKAALVPGGPGSSNISTVDVIAVQKHFLGVTLLTGCRLTAGDTAPPAGISTVDVLAVQKFFLQLAGFANTGKYQFAPTSRSYSPLTGAMTGQNYDTVVLGDVISGFVHRPEGGGGDEPGSQQLTSAVAAVSLPDVNLTSANQTAAVSVSNIDANSKLIGFQGDFTFDERVVNFESQPVQAAGLTSTNWNVTGNVLPGKGPMRTLRVSAFSNDLKPLSGSGVLFELKMTRVSKGAGSTQLVWAAAPDQFIFIDFDLNTQSAGNAAPGSVTIRPAR